MPDEKKKQSLVFMIEVTVDIQDAGSIHEVEEAARGIGDYEVISVEVCNGHSS